MRGQQRSVPRWQLKPRGDVVRQRLGQTGRQTLERVEHDVPLHPGGDRARFLVHRHDPTGVHGLALFLVEDLVLWVRQLHRRAVQFDAAVQDNPLPAHEDVAQVRLIQPHNPQRSAAVVDDRLENLEATAPGESNAAREDPPADRGGSAGLQRANGLQAAAIFVPERKPVQEILDGDEADTFEIGRTPRPDTLEEL